MIELVDIYEGDQVRESAATVLYKLMAEREPTQNISHRVMPTYPEHVQFLEKKPHRFWYMIVSEEGENVGSLYLSKLNEVGVGILPAHRRQGYARAAIKEIVKRHRGERLLANINPQNGPSRRLFTDLGFSPLQITYSLEAGIGTT